MQEEWFAAKLVKDAPSTVYYVPNFITQYEESVLMQRVSDAPKPKWTCLANRRLQDYGGTASSVFTYFNL